MLCKTYRISERLIGTGYEMSVINYIYRCCRDVVTLWRAIWCRAQWAPLSANLVITSEQMPMQVLPAEYLTKACQRSSLAMACPCAYVGDSIAIAV